jgi:hypothetical protein
MSSQSGLINISLMPKGKKSFPPSVSTEKLGGGRAIHKVNLTPALDPRLFGGKPWKRFSFSLFCGGLSSLSPVGKVYSGARKGSIEGVLSDPPHPRFNQAPLHSTPGFSLLSHGNASRRPPCHLLWGLGGILSFLRSPAPKSPSPRRTGNPFA